MRLTAILIFIFAISISAMAQVRSKVEIPVIPANTADVSSIDGLVKAFYETISGAAGQPRQWGRDRNLYIPGVRFAAVNERSGKVTMSVMDHQQYVDAVNDYFVRAGFFEKEIHRVEKRFGNIAHVFSTYETRAKADGPVTARGVNSIELVFDGTRWWIASAIWDEERPNNPIPADLLPPKK